MASYKVKTKYKEEGSWGCQDERTVYAHHDTNGFINIYDHNFELIMCVSSLLENNILDAINKLCKLTDKNDNLLNSVEYVNKDESKLMK